MSGILREVIFGDVAIEEGLSGEARRRVKRGPSNNELPGSRRRELPSV